MGSKRQQQTLANPAREITKLDRTPDGPDRLITAIEGAGKTQALLDGMSSEMMEPRYGCAGARASTFHVLRRPIETAGD